MPAKSLHTRLRFQLHRDAYVSIEKYLKIRGGAENGTLLGYRHRRGHFILCEAQGAGEETGWYGILSESLSQAWRAVPRGVHPASFVLGLWCVHREGVLFPSHDEMVMVEKQMKDISLQVPFQLLLLCQPCTYGIKMNGFLFREGESSFTEARMNGFFGNGTVDVGA
jgi:hypothetical protein